MVIFMRNVIILTYMPLFRENTKSSPCMQVHRPTATKKKAEKKALNMAHSFCLIRISIQKGH